MFVIHCPHCGRRELVGTGSLIAFENTDHGPVALVRCGAGHVVEHQFHAPLAATAGEVTVPAA